MPESVLIRIPGHDVEDLISSYVRCRLPGGIPGRGEILRMYVRLDNYGLTVEVVKSGELFRHEMGAFDAFRRWWKGDA